MKLGIIGGAGPLASALLYETLVQESYACGLTLPEIFLINYPFTRGLTVEEGKNNEQIIINELQGCIDSLARNGVTIGLLACNTMHLFLKKTTPTSIVFHHLPELVVEEAKAKGHERLLILGTQNTCRSHLYGRGIYPLIEQQMRLDRVIDHVLEGKICQEDAFVVGEIIKQMLALMDFDAVVLGCTDLPVLHHHFPIQSERPIYDSIKIPAKSLLGML